MIMEKEKLVALVTAVQQGDSEAANELFCAFYDDLYYHALKTVGDSDTALDVTQEAFVEILNTIGNLKEPAAFVTWAKQITYHQCTRYFRKKVDITVDEDEEGKTIFDNIKEEKTEFIPDEALDKDDFKKTILSFISSLPEEQRAAVMMYYFDEMSVREIAEIQGLSEGTVKSRLNYARKAIKEQVEDYEKKNGIKLHAIPFFPFFGWLFKGAFEGALPAAKVAALTEGVSAATGVALSATTAAATSAAATTAAATAGIGAKIAALPLATKIISGIVAAAIVIGTPTAVILSQNGDDDTSSKKKPSSSVSASADEGDENSGYGGPEEHIHSFTEKTLEKEFGVITIESTLKTCTCGETEARCPYIPILPVTSSGANEFLDRYFETAWGNDGDFSIEGLFAAGDFLATEPYYDQESIEISANEYYENLQKHFTLSDEIINEMKAVRSGDTYTLSFGYNGTHLMQGTTVWLRDNIYRVFFVPSGSHADGMTRYYVDVEYNSHRGSNNKIIAIKPVSENTYDITRAEDKIISGDQFALDILSLSNTLFDVKELDYFAGEYSSRYLTYQEAETLFGVYQLLDVFGYNLTEHETYGQGWYSITPQFEGETLSGLTMSTELPFSSTMSLEEERVMFAQRDIEKFISLAGGKENIEVFDVEIKWPNETETPIDLDSITTEKLAEISEDWCGNRGVRLKTKISLAVGDKKYNLSYTFLSPNGFYHLAHNMTLTITFN